MSLFWSKNAGINDKNLGPYVSVLQRKWQISYYIIHFYNRRNPSKCIQKSLQNITEISYRRPWIDAITLPLYEEYAICFLKQFQRFTKARYGMAKLATLLLAQEVDRSVVCFRFFLLLKL